MNSSQENNPVRHTSTSIRGDEYLKSSCYVLFAASCFSLSGLIQSFAPEGATPITLGSLRVLFSGNKSCGACCKFCGGYWCFSAYCNGS